MKSGRWSNCSANTRNYNFQHFKILQCKKLFNCYSLDLAVFSFPGEDYNLAEIEVYSFYWL